MISRRRFLAAVSALPVIGKLVPAEAKPLSLSTSRSWTYGISIKSVVVDNTDGMYDVYATAIDGTGYEYPLHNLNHGITLTEKPPHK